LPYWRVWREGVEGREEVMQIYVGRAALFFFSGTTFLLVSIAHSLSTLLSHISHPLSAPVMLAALSYHFRQVLATIEA
jgi:hypothetical protein